MKKFKPGSKIDTKSIIDSNYFIPHFNSNWTDIRTNNWFDIKENNYESKNILKTKLDNKDNSILRAKHIKLNLNKIQKTKINCWLEVSRIVYNLTVKYFRYNTLTSFQRVRPIIKQLFSRNLLNLINRFNIPVHIIDNSINDVIKAYKSSIALIKCNEIKYFRIRYKKI